MPRKVKIDKQVSDPLEKLGFRFFDASHALLMVPAKLFDKIPDGTRLRSIQGRDAVKGQDSIDDDTRYGLLAYCLTADNAATVLAALNGTSPT